MQYRTRVYYGIFRVLIQAGRPVVYMYVATYKQLTRMKIGVCMALSVRGGI